MGSIRRTRLAGIGLDRARIAATTAMLVTLVFAGPVNATDWGPLEVHAPAVAADMTDLGGSIHWYASLTEDGWLRVVFRNSGGSWGQSRDWLSFDARQPAIAADDGSVDVVWTTPRGRVAYARSHNGGDRFPFGANISPPGFPEAGLKAIARRGEAVAVAWADQSGSPKRVHVTVSTDDGDHFGPVTSFRTRGTGGFPSIAIGNSVIYLSYFVDDSILVVRRSLNAGAIWRTDTVLARDATHFRKSRGHLAAQGLTAYVVFIQESEPDEFGITTKWTRLRWTNDRGATWAPAADVEPSLHDGGGSHFPIASYGDGELRVIWARCVYDVGCDDADVFYRRRTGAGWSSIEQVSNSLTVRNVPVGVARIEGYPDRTLVMFLGANEPYRSDPDVYSREGTP